MEWIDRSESSVFSLAKKSCQVLNDPFITQSLCEQIIKNLLFLTMALHRKVARDIKKDKNMEWITQLKKKQKEAYRLKIHGRKLSSKRKKELAKESRKKFKEELMRARREKNNWMREMEDTFAKSKEEDVEMKESRPVKTNNKKRKKATKRKRSEMEETDRNVEEFEEKSLLEDAKEIEKSGFIPTTLAFDAPTGFPSKKHGQSGRDYDDPNWRVKEIFEFMTDRISQFGTPLVSICFFSLLFFRGQRIYNIAYSTASYAMVRGNRHEV